MYGEPYMKQVERDAERIESRDESRNAGRSLRLTLRGFSPAELRARAEQECACHFGGREWALAESEYVPRLRTLGGRVLLYEGRFVATG